MPIQHSMSILLQLISSILILVSATVFDIDNATFQSVDIGIRITDIYIKYQYRYRCQSLSSLSIDIDADIGVKIDTDIDTDVNTNISIRD